MFTGHSLLQERYRLNAQLGHNAGRQTWLADDQVAHCPVVVKLLAFSPQMQWDELKLFEREADVLRHLDHPGIPRYRDYFVLNRTAGAGLCQFGLVQSYVPGDSLQAVLNQGRHFTEREVRQIAIQVLEILSYLHAQDPVVLHRDIKPSNLILDAEQRVYLVDFGSVQNQAAMEGVTFTIVGTTGYAPLEQFWGRAVPASDLYALGATLIHLLTGTAPAALPQRNLRIQFADRVSVAPAFINWVMALTEPDLEQRYQSAEQALSDLIANRSLTYAMQPIPAVRGSRIRLHRSPQQLDIQIPSQPQFLLLDVLVSAGITMLLVGSLLAIITALTGLLLFLFGILISLSSVQTIGVAGLLSSLIIALLGLALFRSMHHITGELPKLLERVVRSPLRSLRRFQLQGNREQIQLCYSRLGSSTCHQFSPQQWVDVVPSRQGEVVLLLQSRQPSKLILGYRLSLPERRWLMQELQDWLEQVR